MKVKVEKLLGISYFRPPYVSIAIVHFCYFRSFNFLRSPVYPTKKKKEKERTTKSACDEIHRINDVKQKLVVAISNSTLVDG